MKLSFSTNAFVRHSVYDAVECIDSLGYDGVELLADVPHLYADTVTESDLARLKSVLGETALQVANINANTAVGYYERSFWEPLFEPSLANPDPDARRWRIDYSKKCIDMARFLGAPCISVTSGKPVPGIRPEESLALLTKSLEELAEYAAERSVKIGIEYEPGLLIERCGELAVFLKYMNSSQLGANLDLGHSHLAGENPAEVLMDLEPWLLHIHMEDIAADKHYHLIPGEGEVDFLRLFTLLDRIEYEGFATVELYTYPDTPEQAARESFEFLNPVLDSVAAQRAREVIPAYRKKKGDRP